MSVRCNWWAATSAETGNPRAQSADGNQEHKPTLIDYKAADAHDEKLPTATSVFMDLDIQNTSKYEMS